MTVPVENSGLRLIASSHAAIWLPDGYVGGHPIEDVGVFEAAIADRGSQWRKWFKEWHRRSTGAALVAFDASAPTPDRATEMFVSFFSKRLVDRPNLTLEEHTDAMAKKIARKSKLESVQSATVNGRPASRVECSGKTDWRRGIRRAHWLFFLMVTDVAAWNVGFVMPIDEAPAHLPTLLRSAETFEIKSEPPL